MENTEYAFDPTYGYTLAGLLAVAPPTEPSDFDRFWQRHYAAALAIRPEPRFKLLNADEQGWQVYAISYLSTDAVQINGWLLLPVSGVIERGFVIGHGYGGREQPDFHLPLRNAALLFPCFRGLALSALPTVSTEPYQHILTAIDDAERYILGGCVADVWLGVTTLLQLFPQLHGHIGYLGISFAGGIGALALAFDKRIARGHLNVPTFGHHPLRLRLPTLGSTHSLSQYYCGHKKRTLRVLRYFDAALAAKRIRQPMHCACALFDPCVAPPAQFAIFNALPGIKQLFQLNAGHHAYPAQALQEQQLLAQLEAFFAELNS